MADKVLKTSVVVEADSRQMVELERQARKTADALSAVEAAARKANEEVGKAPVAPASSPPTPPSPPGGSGGGGGTPGPPPGPGGGGGVPGVPGGGGAAPGAPGGGGAAPGAPGGGPGSARGLGLSSAQMGRGWRRTRGTQMPDFGVSSLARAAGNLPIVGGIAAGAIYDVIAQQRLLQSVQTAQSSTKALLGRSGNLSRGTELVRQSQGDRNAGRVMDMLFGGGQTIFGGETRAKSKGNLYSLGQTLGMNPEEVEGIVTTLAGSGLGLGDLAGEGAGVSSLAMALQRGRGINASTTAGLVGAFRAGGGGVLPGGMSRSAGIMASVMGGVRAGEAAGLNNADIPRYLERMTQGITQLAERGIDVDPRSLMRLDGAFRQMGGDGAFGGFRGQSAALGFSNALQDASQGGGSPLARLMMFRAALEVGGADNYLDAKFAFEKSGANPDLRAKMLAHVIRQVRNTPGDSRTQADLLQRNFRFLGLGQSKALIEGGDLDIDGLGLDVDTAEALKAELATAKKATGSEMQRGAKYRLQDINDAQKQGVGNIYDLIRRPERYIRRGARDWIKKGADFIESVEKEGTWAAMPDWVKDLMPGGAAGASKAVKEKLKGDEGASLGDRVLLDLTPEARALLTILGGDMQTTMLG